MAGYSDYLENKILGHLFNNNSADFTPGGTLYVALFTAAPADSGGGTEVSGNAYARVAVTNTSASWGLSGATISNLAAITFAAPSPSAWGTVTHFGIYDASSAGNLWGWNALSVSRATSVGVALSFAIGALTITQD